MSINNSLSPSTRTYQILEHLFVFILLCLLFYFLFGSALTAQFALVDDHQILNVAAQKETNFNVIWNGILSNIIQNGRFRPGYNLIYIAEVTLFGINPYLWHLAFIGYGVITCYFLYIAARQIGADVVSALLFILLCAVTGSQNSVWYRLGTGETWGLLSTALALAALTKAAHQTKPNTWDGFALFFMFIAGFFKEGFVLLIPALLWLRLILHRWFYKENWSQALRTLKTPLLVGMLGFVMEMILVGAMLVYRPNNYGAKIVGLSSTSFAPLTLYRLLITSELAPLAAYVPIFCALILILSWRQRKQTYLFIFSTFLIFILVVVPQLILYRKGIGGHYLFPAVIGFAALGALGLSVMWHRRSWILGGISLVWLLLLIWFGVQSTISRCTFYTADTLALNEMITYLVKHVDRSQVIIIAADPSADYEGTVSLRTHLRFAGLNVPFYLLPVFPLDDRFDKQLATKLINIHFAGFTELETVKPNKIGAIIGLQAPNAKTAIPSWYVPSQWEALSFTKPYYNFSLKELTYVRAGNRGYTILMPVDQ